MLDDLSVVEGPYLRDILDQSRALEDTLTGLEISKPLQQLANAVQRGKFRTIILTGMGASFHALHPVNLRLVIHGFATVMVETSELVHYQSRWFDPKTLIVAVSQSGLSAEVVRLLKVNRGKSPVIAVTNTADSPLAKQSDAAVLTRAGKEFSVSCKTYVTALMALQWLGDLLCGGNLRRATKELKSSGPVVQDYLSRWKDHVTSMAQPLKGVRSLFLVGRGSSLAAVGAGALVIKESDHFHAEGMGSAAFRHGPFEMISDQTFVLVFGGDKKTHDLNRRLLEDIRGQQGRAEVVSETNTIPACTLPAAPGSLRPILEILPAQMITLALAVQAGREPGRFDRASKVTTTE